MATEITYQKIKDKPGRVLVTETRTYEEDVTYYHNELSARENALSELKPEIPADKLTTDQAAAVEKENAKIRAKRSLLESDRDILTAKIAAMESAKEIAVAEVIK